ncbi:MAG: ABC transporter ATP-binding protein [Defluviitaleaceae bacterium]|nr:ABC transporter ATP-binding protein [Defluviitaleaceae bacterium]
MQPIISFENFTFQYRAQKEPSLADINLSINQGEKVLIAGASGSGKSTLANCINGLIPFNHKGTASGSCKVNGVDTSKLSVFELSKIVGTVLQDTDGQFVGLTAGEDIAFSLENNCLPKEEMLPQVKTAACKTGIGDAFLDTSPFDLSGGQKQRVSMAGILVDDIQILLFDEPLASLDPSTGKNTIALIDKIRHDTSKTVIIIEHRLEDVLYRDVDRVVIMHDGRIVSDMPTAKLLSGSLLREHGLREPLYISAMRYAGIAPAEEHKLARIDQLTLSQGDKATIKNWYQNLPPAEAEQNQQELLRVSNLNFTYPSKDRTLQNISFTITRGEMTAIVGTNGAGKSTMAKLICGFEQLDSGKIELFGQDITEETIFNRAKHIGYVMQNPNQMICKPMIFDEVALGLVNQGIDEAEIKQRVEATLEICGLHPFRNWPVSALSYGQKKRVTIASVLVMNPEIIILDEPTAGQDYRHYTEIMEFLKALQAKGVTVLLITHDMHLMLEYAPRALVFSGGNLVADLPSATLLCDPVLSEKASLKETSLFHLAAECEIDDPAAFTRCFIEYERAKS